MSSLRSFFNRLLGHIPENVESASEGTDPGSTSTGPEEENQEIPVADKTGKTLSTADGTGASEDNEPSTGPEEESKEVSAADGTGVSEGKEPESTSTDSEEEDKEIPAAGGTGKGLSTADGTGVSEPGSTSTGAEEEDKEIPADDGTSESKDTGPEEKPESDAGVGVADDVNVPQQYLVMPLEEKHKLYECKSDYVTLDKIETWAETRKTSSIEPRPSPFSPSSKFDEKVSIWQGDITRLEIDAVVNAANTSLLGGGGIDGAIHRAAGNSLYDECLGLNGCPTGQTKITSGHQLPAKNILHTVGPTNRSKEKLEGCYRTCFDLILKHELRSVAFCCITTGIYGYPNEAAAEVALSIAREWLEENADKVDRIIFCVFLEEDLKIYHKRLDHFFPASIPQQYLAMPLEEKRKLYKCKSDYVTLDKIETWAETRKMSSIESRPSPFSPSSKFDEKVSLWRGDITTLEIDAVVNAAKASLEGGGGIDGAIHRAAGSSLYDECVGLNGCPTGQTKITSGHCLPAKYILHTVGPSNRSKEKLEGCYRTCFDLILEHELRSVAFCCIATGIYGYPNEGAAEVALSITREWLEENADKVDRIIFCVFLEKDLKIYRKRLNHFFPINVPQQYLAMPLKEKRKLYKCKSNYVTLNKIETWAETRKMSSIEPRPSPFSPSSKFDEKVSLWQGDITRLEIDAVVNAANTSLLGGGGIDGAIHTAAGNSLYDECFGLNGCPTGQTKITSGHRLPAKYILHTVGPSNRSKEKLEGCYRTCFDLILKHELRSVAFCCVSTGIYGYPNEGAAEVALSITREWLEENTDKVDRIIFCVFLEKDLKIYRQKLNHFFPLPPPPPPEVPEKESQVNSGAKVETGEHKEEEGSDEKDTKKLDISTGFEKKDKRIFMATSAEETSTGGGETPAAADTSEDRQTEETSTGAGETPTTADTSEDRQTEETSTGAGETPTTADTSADRQTEETSTGAGETPAAADASEDRHTDETSTGAEGEDKERFITDKGADPADSMSTVAPAMSDPAVKDSESALSFGGSVLPDPSLPDDNGNSSSPDNDISSAIKSFDTEDKGRMFDEAMKEGYVEASIIKILMVGAAGVGKTSLVSRLLDLVLSLTRVSTGCLEKARRVMSNLRFGMSEGDKVWELVGPTELMKLLAEAITTGTKKRTDDSSLPLPEAIDDKPEVVNSPLVPETINPSNTSSYEQSTFKQSGDTRLDSDTKESYEVARTTVVKLIGHSRSGKLLNMTWIYLIDSGGQPQFHEMLTAFIRKTTLGIFVFKLSERLDDKPMIEYYGKDGKPCGDPYQFPLSHKEIFQHCIQTIYSLPSTEEDKSPKILIVGTHRDMEKNCSESRDEKNDAIKNILHPQSVRHGDSIVYYRDQINHQCVFPVNVKSPEPQDKKIVHNIRCVIEEIKPTPVPIPLQYYALEIEIETRVEKYQQNVISMKECLSIAYSLKFTEKSALAAIYYLDSLNLVQYFPEIADNVLFCNPNVLLNKVDELVQESYRLRGVIPSEPDYDIGGKWLHFHKCGQFTLNVLSSFSTGYVKGLYDHIVLAKILESLFLLTYFEEEDIYFMPALLELKKPEDIQRPTKECLIISFPEGYAPLGLFSSAVAFLTSAKNHHPWKILHKSNHQLFRNIIRFELEVSIITLIDMFTHFEIHVQSKYAQSKLYPVVQKEVLDAIEQVMAVRHVQNTSYTCNNFFCSCSDHSQLHLAEAFKSKFSDEWLLKCTITCTQQKLKEFHHHWLEIPQKEHSVHFTKEKPSLKALLIVLLPLAADWHNIGILLDIPEDRLATIKKDNPQSGDCVREMIVTWLNVNPEPSWEKIAEAVKVTHPNKAKEIRSQYVHD